MAPRTSPGFIGWGHVPIGNATERKAARIPDRPGSFAGFLMRRNRSPCPLCHHRPSNSSSSSSPRSRIPARVVFDKHVRVLVFGCANDRMAVESYSASTAAKARRVDRLRACSLSTRIIGPELSEVAFARRIARVDKSPVDRYLEKVAFTAKNSQDER